jgi:hypothetical protein
LKIAIVNAQFSIFNAPDQRASGQKRIRTSEVERQRIYSPPHLAALESALMIKSEMVAISIRNYNCSGFIPPIRVLLEPLVGIEPTTY